MVFCNLRKELISRKVEINESPVASIRHSAPLLPPLPQEEEWHLCLESRETGYRSGGEREELLSLHRNFLQANARNCAGDVLNPSKPECCLSFFPISTVTRSSSRHERRPSLLQQRVIALNFALSLDAFQKDEMAGGTLMLLQWRVCECVLAVCPRRRRRSGYRLAEAKFVRLGTSRDQTKLRSGRKIPPSTRCQ